MDGAGGCGYLDVVKWLHENRMGRCTVKAMDLAARNGYLDTVKWLHENRTEGCTTQAMNWAADVVKFLYANKIGCYNKGDIYWAERNGHYDVGRFLREKINDCLYFKKK